MEDTSLLDLDDSVRIEMACLRFGYEKLYGVTALLLRVDHRDIRLDEVAKNLVCVRPKCRHVGA